MNYPSNKRTLGITNLNRSFIGGDQASDRVLAAAAQAPAGAHRAADQPAQVCQVAAPPSQVSQAAAEARRSGGLCCAAPRSHCG